MMTNDHQEHSGVSSSSLLKVKLVRRRSLLCGVHDPLDETGTILTRGVSHLDVKTRLREMYVVYPFLSALPLPLSLFLGVTDASR